MRFGLSTHLYHGERLARRHFEAVAGAGIDLVELFATRTHLDYGDSRHVAAIKAWLDDLGIAAGSMHLPISTGVAGGVWGRPYSNASADPRARQEAVDETVAALHAAAELGCAIGVLHLGLPREFQTSASDNSVAAMRRALEPIAAAAGAVGVQLALEVIPNDLSSPEALRGLFDGQLELGSAGVCLDVGHAHLLGGAPDAAETLSGHVITTHIHDNRGAEDEHLVPFAGTVDWPQTLMALSKTGYQGALVFEVADAGDAPGVLERTVGARRRLQAILDELGAAIEFE